MEAKMAHEYSGYLRHLPFAPDPEARHGLDHVFFGSEDLAQWNLADDKAHEEWPQIPAQVERGDDGVQLTGNFEDIRRIDNLDPQDPSFWVPLTSQGWQDGRFPVDLARYPIVEITYRSPSHRARPAWVLGYQDGVHFDGLQSSSSWRTIVRRVSYNDFPNEAHYITFRLYATERTTETLSLQSVCFRAMTPSESEACEKDQERIEAAGPPKEYPLLNDFMPLGVCLKAGSAKRMAETMDISLRDYWRLAFEDVARHYHNCVFLQEMEHLTPEQWREALSLAESFDIRLLAQFDWPMEEYVADEARLREAVDQHIRPYADSPAVLGWALQDEPPEHSFHPHLKARKIIEEADPNHPLAIILRDPNAVSLYGPEFAACGMAHFKTHAPWEVQDLVQRHLPLAQGQHLWVVAPTFVYATDTPKWNTCPELRLMLNSSLAAGARGWISFAYGNDPIWLGGHCQRSLTGPFLTFSDLWSELGHRMERLSVLTPLLLASQPGPDPGIGVEVQCETHPRSQRPADIPPLQEHWLHGPDFHLLYVVSTDISEVTPVYITLTGEAAGTMAAYDASDFARHRKWTKMERRRHIEMFPGQGNCILFASDEVCAHWRDVIAHGLMVNDRKQLVLNVDLARRFDLDISDVEDMIGSIGEGAPLDDLNRMHDIHDRLLNTIYDAPNLYEPRSRLIQASAAICGCDGALCRLQGKGRADDAHEMGLKVLPLTRQLARLRLKLREGTGEAIHDDCVRLANDCLVLLEAIRKID